MGEKREGIWKGWGQESEQAANCVNKRGCLFSIFSYNLTYCYTAAVRLIHSSAGSQYMNSNYTGIFFVIFGCHPSLDQESLCYMQRPA